MVTEISLRSFDLGFDARNSEYDIQLPDDEENSYIINIDPLENIPGYTGLVTTLTGNAEYIASTLKLAGFNILLPADYETNFAGSTVKLFTLDEIEELQPSKETGDINR